MVYIYIYIYREREREGWDQMIPNITLYNIIQIHKFLLE
jgi:hypothetical protein